MDGRGNQSVGINHLKQSKDGKVRGKNIPDSEKGRINENGNNDGSCLEEK